MAQVRTYFSEWWYFNRAGHIVKTDVEINLSVLAGKSVVITGAARGLGRAYAKAFARAGAFVTIGDIDIKAANDLIAELDDPNETPSEPALATTDVNLKGLLYTTKLATHYFRRFQKRDGVKDRCLILKSSIASFIDWPKALQYLASKAAKDGIRVNVVAPAFVDTGIIPKPFKSKLIAARMQFASIDDAVKAVLRVSCDPTIHGRSLAVILRAFASEGYVDLESDDLAPEDNLYAFEQMALNMKV
ncbi:hypothetical protein D6C89_07574 [Aureobasidium pullulans]|nr:hypothetical protein D6C89_07574 [Aureobasidium pullulans]